MSPALLDAQGGCWHLPGPQGLETRLWPRLLLSPLASEWAAVKTFPVSLNLGLWLHTVPLCLPVGPGSPGNSQC